MRRFLKDWGVTILLCLGIVFLRIAVFDVTKVQGKSMYPTLEQDDKLLVEKISTHTENYERGDIVILDSHRGSKEAGISKYWVKRVIAISGDTIECKNSKVYVNDVELSEEYINDDIITSDIFKVTVPEGKMFVMGDNRQHSSDSREIGFIDYDDIYAKVVFNMNNLF